MRGFCVAAVAAAVCLHAHVVKSHPDKYWDKVERGQYGEHKTCHVPKVSAEVLQYWVG